VHSLFGGVDLGANDLPTPHVQQQITRNSRFTGVGRYVMSQLHTWFGFGPCAMWDATSRTTGARARPRRVSRSSARSRRYLVDYDAR
jgi:hypothetical protein